MTGIAQSMGSIVDNLNSIIRAKARNGAMYSIKQCDTFFWGRYLKRTRKLDRLVKHYRRKVEEVSEDESDDGMSTAGVLGDEIDSDSESDFEFEAARKPTAPPEIVVTKLVELDLEA